MKTVDFETAIAEFLALGRRLQDAQDLCGERVLDELCRWYLGTRVEGAPADGMGQDMLLLQWGATRVPLLSAPIDMRPLGDGELKYDDQNRRYLDFTRQLFVMEGAHAEGEDIEGVEDEDDDDEDEEFDDAAVQLSITLGFDVAVGSEPMSNRWIESLAGVDDGKAAFGADPFVQSLMCLTPSRVSVTVGYCG